MNRSIFIAVLFIFAAAFSFAEGQNEAPVQPGPGPLKGNPSAEDTFEEVTLTGAVDLSGFAPRLVTKDETYMLMVPRILPEGVEVADGDEITVTGYLHDAPRGYGRGYVTDASVKVIGVTKAVIGGQEYDIPRGYGPRGFARGAYDDGYPCWDDEPRGRGGRGSSGRRGGSFGSGRPMGRW
ncbi:MAG: hypothetical protein JXB03_05850 [Spirochaetales bacterium]|nr:hypothetical protein [Spirochaetales bacterium]